MWYSHPHYILNFYKWVLFYSIHHSWQCVFANYNNEKDINNTSLHFRKFGEFMLTTNQSTRMPQSGYRKLGFLNSVAATNYTTSLALIRRMGRSLTRTVTSTVRMTSTTNILIRRRTCCPSSNGGGWIWKPSLERNPG